VPAFTGENLIVWLVVGGLAGWLSEAVVKTSRFGVAGDVVLGVLGAFLGSWILPAYGLLPDLGSRTAERFVGALVGAAVLLTAFNLVRQLAAPPNPSLPRRRRRLR
jgi:uncharacterized membrane protein YeaQ/YmgE (transglycosylase-associated protein family)